jgi:hypothetical protein
MKDLIQKDEVKIQYEALRKNAIALGKAWANRLAQTYTEPTRAGTKKGEPIGLSRKKFHAGLLMILYDDLLGLKEIATIVKVSPGLLKVWRTESKFKEVMQFACDWFIKRLIKTIDTLLYKRYGEIGDKKSQKILEEGLLKSDSSLNFLVNFPYGDPNNPDDQIEIAKALSHILPFFNKATFPTIVEWLKKRIDAGSLLHIFIAQNAKMSSMVKDKKTQRKWEIKSLPITKALIEGDLKLLMESDPSKSKNTESYMISLRDLIFRTFDILAQ